MAVTKELTKAVPFEKEGKVEKWEFEYTYENDSEGDATYFTNVFSRRINSMGGNGITVIFVPKPEADWTKAELVALCPVALWDEAFANQVDSLITNPPVKPVADTDYTIPE